MTTKLETTLVEAAKEWWSWNRPVGCSLGQHLANPTINCCHAASEDALAEAVAALIRSELNDSKTRIQNENTCTT